MTPSQLFDHHLPLLRQALAAVGNRVYWTPFTENPAALDEASLAAGKAAFQAYRDASFYLDQPGVVGRNGREVSPYGFVLNVSYPVCNPDALILAARGALVPWVKAGPEARVGVCIEILKRLEAHGVELAQAAMHTTGQSFSFAYQFSVAQALDRGLEAVACAYREMKQVPGRSTWTRGNRHGAIAMDKTFTPVPRGMGLVVACSVSPTWNAFPGIFANLATGNPVMVKPHPEVILPLAITVATARGVLKEAGFDPDLISLLVDDETGTMARIAALKTEVRLIDYTGGRLQGQWLEENAHQAVLFAQKSSLNCVVVDGTDDYRGLLRNLTLTLCLNSGQLGATPRLILTTREGVKTPQGIVSSEQFGRDLALALGRFCDEGERALDVLGCLRSERLLKTLALARQAGEVLRDSAPLEHPQWPQARVHSPMLVKIGSRDGRPLEGEPFGPVCFLTEAATTAEALVLAEKVMEHHGALAFGLHSLNPHFQALAEDVSLRLGVPLHLNLTGKVLMNQYAAYADFYGTGANPGANCSFTDSAFVSRRFFLVQTQRPAA
ncbi:phenylacetic acid degradation protein PaaN [Denitratisoma sp. agr-D3]